MVTDFVVPLMVRSPVRSKLSAPVSVTEVETKVIFACSSVPKKSLVRRWASRSALRVSTLSASISTSTFESARVSPTVAVPE